MSKIQFPLRPENVIQFYIYVQSVFDMICTMAHFYRLHRLFPELKLHCLYLLLRRDAGDVHSLSQF